MNAPVYPKPVILLNAPGALRVWCASQRVRTPTLALLHLRMPHPRLPALLLSLGRRCGGGATKKTMATANCGGLAATPRLPRGGAASCSAYVRPLSYLARPSCVATSGWQGAPARRTWAAPADLRRSLATSTSAAAAAGEAAPAADALTPATLKAKV